MKRAITDAKAHAMMADTAPTKSDILGVVLAGGQSRRMGGRDKAWQMLAGRPFITHVLERLTPQVDAVTINTNGDRAAFEQAFDVPVFADTIGGHAGPLAGVLSGLRHAEKGAWTHVATAATDTPFFPADLVQRLALPIDTADAIAMAHWQGQRHPVFTLWPVALADDLQAWLESAQTFKVMAWVQRHRLARVEFGHRDTDQDPFFNINTPEDLLLAERIATANAEPAL